MNFKRFAPKAFRFRRFSRRSDAAFLSLHREVNIGRVSARIADLELLKSGRKMAVVSLMWGAATAYATEPADSDSIPDEDEHEVELQEVRVQAQRPDFQFQTYRLMTQVSGKRLQQLPVQTVADVLAYLPGVDIRTRGANGAQADLSMRGGSFDQVSVMVNGVNLNDAQTGHYALNLPISTELVQRIEVLQGAAPSQFGLNAFSGAVNIVTRPDYLVDTTRVCTRLTGGMYGLVNPSVAADWARGDWLVRAGMEYCRADGYRSGMEYDGTYLAPDPLSKEQIALKNTDLQKADAYVFASWRGLEMQVGAQYKDAGAGMFYGFGSQDQFDATRTVFGSVRHRYYINRWCLETQASYRANYDRYEWHRGQRLYGNFHFLQTAALSAKVHYDWHLGKTSWGLELRNENLSSTNLGDTIRPDGQVPNVEGFDLKDLRVLRLVKGANRFHVNYFVEQSLNYYGFSASLGVSGNYNAATGHHLSGGADFSYRYGYADQSSVYLRVNRTLRLPVFTDLYYDAGNQLGNPGLQPETAWLLSVGTKYNVGDDDLRLSLSLDGYYRWGRNIIDWVYVPSDTRRPFHAANHERVDATGVEMSAVCSCMDDYVRLSLSYAYAYLDLDLAGSGSRYLDYLSHKAVLGVVHTFWRKTTGFSLWERWETGAVWQLSYKKREGEYNDAEGVVQAYRPVWLLDGSVYWKNDRLKVSLSCTNITHFRYYDYGGVLQPGAWAKLTVGYKW
ncbi:MAG: TonB-dependent receptor plug domain-containing protein [Paludibacteraceae bacterium]|nr:TonB-dependent receptor plug domain-containing protein [Paludibacteraceae bacterium]